MNASIVRANSSVGEYKICIPQEGRFQGRRGVGNGFGDEEE